MCAKAENSISIVRHFNIIKDTHPYLTSPATEISIFTCKEVTIKYWVVREECKNEKDSCWTKLTFNVLINAFSGGQVFTIHTPSHPSHKHIAVISSCMSLRLQYLIPSPSNNIYIKLCCSLNNSINLNYCSDDVLKALPCHQAPTSNKSHPIRWLMLQRGQSFPVLPYVNN